jgi:hypothetical protein
LEDCERALSLNASFGKAYKRRYQCHLKMGELEAAMGDIEKLLKLEPGD